MRCPDRIKSRQKLKMRCPEPVARAYNQRSIREPRPTYTLVLHSPSRSMARGVAIESLVTRLAA